VKLWRKPATAEWYHNSAWLVEDVDVTDSKWTGHLMFYLDGTKDKSGSKHTSLRLDISETEVEKLYKGLLKGRLAKLKECQRESDRLRKRLDKIDATILSKWAKTPNGSDEERILESLRDKL